MSPYIQSVKNINTNVPARDNTNIAISGEESTVTKTVAIRGERTIISSDESWLKHVEEQGAKGAGTFKRTDEQRESDRKATKQWLMSLHNNSDRKAGGRK